MNIKPYRAYSEHDVINGLFTFDGLSANKGTFVTPVGSGAIVNYDLTLDDISSVDGTLSSKFNVPNKVVPAPSGTLKNNVLGMLLYDHRTVDENNKHLLWEPRKRVEMEVTITGDAVPILTKGLVLYSGIVGNAQFGTGAAVADAGDGSLKTVALGSANCIGRFLGPKDAQGYALLEFDVTV